MTPERWRQIEEIFHAVLELPASERLEFLSKHADGDDALRSEVEKLLDQFDEADSFISQPLLDSTRGGVLSSLLDDSDDDPLTGELLGKYRIEREIGRGGMGAVYEASRADGEFRLKVAVKVVKRGVDTDFVLRRFRNERQILAALDHAYITRLIDGGTTTDGRPYFVMDYIDGLPLYRYADKNRLSVTDRVRLFSRICDAVEYAHQKLVIHRDLKPSNILVVADGTPRLLDFGIAKLLDPEMAVDTLQPTATALRMMTVDYASPEQVKGDKITFATDVYSLGVILFELLTGRRPYKTRNRSAHDVARAICDDAPELPSRAVAEGTAPAVPVNMTATTLSGPEGSGRSENREDIALQLEGNLDNIIMKALRKEPSERYASVDELRTDIEGHLAGGEVDAPLYYPREDQSIHGTYAPEGKLLAVLPLSLLSPSGLENTDAAYLTIGLADAIITRLTSVRKLTVRPTSSITRYNEHQINPLRAGRELGVDFVLDGRIRRFGDRLRISLQLLDVARGSAIWAGQFDEHLTDVLELEDAISAQVAAALIPQLTGEERKRLAKRGTNDPKAYEAYLRGRFHWNQFTSQSLPKALEAFECAIELDPEYALAHVGIADFYIWGNIYGLIPVPESYRKADAAARRALEIDPELGEAYASLALLEQNQFHYARAEELFRHSIRLNPNNALAHEWYAASLVGLGRTDQGLEEMALTELLDPLSLRTKTLVAWYLYQAGQFQRALAKAEEITALDANYPQGHLQRGNVLCQLGRTDEAVESIRHCIELMPGSSLSESHYAFALAAAGRHEEARQVAAEMKARSEREYIKPMFLGLASLAAGDVEEAFRYFEISVEERDPWLIWFGTDAKLEPIRSDERYLSIMERIGQPVGGEGPSRLSAYADRGTLISKRAPTTGSAPDLPTGGLPQSFWARHRVAMGAVATIAIVLVLAWSTGFLTVSFTREPSATLAPTPRSIAILPFLNATGDGANDYIADGLSENLISRMSNNGDIRTMARNAAFAFKSSGKDPVSIGRELGVDNVLMGTLTKDGDELSVQTDLIRVSDGKQLFSIFFAEHADRIVALQEKMVARVIEAIDLHSKGRPSPLQNGLTQNNQAFEAYLQGEFLRQKGTPDTIRQSIENYQKAVLLDKDYALAYQGLALAYRQAPDFGLLPPKDAYPKATEAAQHALSIDPSLSSAYVVLASIKSTYEWDFSKAEEEYKKAITMGPNNAETHYAYGNFLTSMGRGNEALVEFRTAQQLDPLSPYVRLSVGWAMYIAGRYDEAAEQIKSVIAAEPTMARAYLNLGEIQQEQGKYDEAVATIQKGRDLSRDPLSDMALGHIYAVSGRTAEARKIAADLEDKVRAGQVSPFLPGVVYAGLNDKDKAFYWLERAYQERSNWLTLIKVGRRLKNLHGDPRFDDLLKRVGFTA